MRSGAIRTKSFDVDMISCFVIGSGFVNKIRKLSDEGQIIRLPMYEMAAGVYESRFSEGAEVACFRIKSRIGASFIRFCSTDCNDFVCCQAVFCIELELC